MDLSYLLKALKADVEEEVAHFEKQVRPLMAFHGPRVAWSIRDHISLLQRTCHLVFDGLSISEWDTVFPASSGYFVTLELQRAMTGA